MKNKPDIKLYEVFKEEAAFLEEALQGACSFVCTSNTIQQEGDTELPAPLISVRTQSQIPLSWAVQLKGILTRSQGFDHLLRYQEVSGADVLCGYLPDYCVNAVAEQALTMMLTLLRRWKKQQRQMRSFNRDGLTGLEANGRRALVVGVGRIGSHLVRLLQNIGMPVKGVDIDPKTDICPYVDLRDGVCWADVVFSAVPATPVSTGMFNADLFAQMTRPGIFVNVSRGEVSPLPELMRALDAGVLAGVGLDVFEQETELGDALRSEDLTEKVQQLRAFAARDNVVCTPHNAFNTEEAVERKAHQSVSAIKQFLQEATFPHTCQ